MKWRFLLAILSFLGLAVVLPALPASSASAPAAFEDWPDWRGPHRDGVSPATGLPESWSPEGENLVWEAPYGGISAPIVMDGRLYLLNGIGEGPTRHERLVCLDAATGEPLWERRFNVTLSDVPPRRVGWSSPVGDPETGNVYVFGVDGQLVALDPSGEIVWQQLLSEMFGTLSTHGGRTVSPIIEGGNVIVSSVSTGWGALAPPAHRFFAFDKATGDVVWISATPDPPYDTTFAPPIVREIDGTRLLVQGGSDGAVHGLEANTGELVWSYPMSKRGINTGVVLYGNTAIVSHGEENLDTSTMGYIAAIPADAEGGIDEGSAVWSKEGFLGGYSSPVVDGQRVYQIDNGANLVAFDLETGEELWRQNLGTIQRSSPVLADGKLYVGTQNGTFYILRPSESGVEILDQDDLSDDGFEEIVASVAVAEGKVFLVSSEATYAIGTGSGSDPDVDLDGRAALEPGASGPVTHVQVVPKEKVLAPGETLRFEARLFNENGELVRVATDGVEWSTGTLQGEFTAPGVFVAADEGAQAGQIEATVDGITGAARARVIPDLPIEMGFEGLQRPPSHWVNAGIKYEGREVDGEAVLVKTTDLRTKRARTYVGRTEWSDMTIQVDVNSALERRRLADAGVVAQRYELLMMGNKQTFELSDWRAEDQRAIVVPYSWQPDTWYTIKMRTENGPGGVRVQGKAWPRDEPEPDEWQIDEIYPEGNRFGSPGIYADAHAEVMLDNLTVTSNR